MTEQDQSSRPNSKVCSAEHAGILDNRLRRLVQNPDKILSGLVHAGQKVLDVGCGPGFFTLAMARIVGDEGRVIAADLQQEMLDRLRGNARNQNLESRIQFHLCKSDSIGLAETVDFALAFYMVHEVPDPEAFLREIYGVVRSGGELLLVEPKFHVSGPAFRRTVELAQSIGFTPIAEPRIVLSRSTLLRRD